MWDWSSFLSGVIGAFVGGGATIVVALLGRNDTRSIAVREHTGTLVDSFSNLASVRSQSDVVDGAYRGPTGEAVDAVNRAIAGLAMVATRKSDRFVCGWAAIMVVSVLDEDDDFDRMSIATGIGQNLAFWASGRLSNGFFKKDGDRVAQIHEGRDPH